MTNPRQLAAFLAAIGLSLVLVPDPVQAAAFTYQGRLTDAGAAVNQPSDVLFRLWDASSGGTQVGVDLQLDAVSVSDGVFTCELDFGATAFDGSARWLEISARTPTDPSDTQPFVLLTPRQALSPAPYAMRALEGAPGWEVTPGVVTNTDGTFVGINRDFLVGSEVFGIHSNTTSAYGGMYVTTQGPSGRPFYGYRDIDSGRTGWTYLHHDESWRLHLGSDRLTMTSAGNFGVGTTTPAERLDVAGRIRSTTGGFVFPDGSVQTTAAGAATGNTLDQAYDEGGTGAGSTINVTTGSPVNLLGSADVSLSGNGLLMLGSATSTNIAIDNNEMSARNNGAAAELHFNITGGDVSIGNSGSKVGVGTSSALTTMHVAGELHISGATDDISVPHGSTLRFSQQDATTSDPMLDMKEVTGAAFVVGYGDNGNGNFYFTAEQANPNHGWIDVSDADGNPQAGVYVSSSGNGVVWGDTKNFRIPNPRDPNSDIVYASLEGPEAAAYSRGTGRLVGGRATIALPQHFQDVASAKGMTVHITPRSANSKGLAVVERSLEGFEVRELMQGTGTYQFDWEVKAVRAAHRDFQVIQPRIATMRPKPTNIAEDAGDPR